MKYNLPKVPRLLPSSLLERETFFLGKQQLYVFVYYTIAILVGLGFNLIGVSGPQKEFNRQFGIHPRDHHALFRIPVP